MSGWDRHALPVARLARGTHSVSGLDFSPCQGFRVPDFWVHSPLRRSRGPAHPHSICLSPQRTTPVLPVGVPRLPSRPSCASRSVPGVSTLLVTVTLGPSSLRVYTDPVPSVHPSSVVSVPGPLVSSSPTGPSTVSDEPERRQDVRTPEAGGWEGRCVQGFTRDLWTVRCLAGE